MRIDTDVGIARCMPPNLRALRGILRLYGLTFRRSGLVSAITSRTFRN